MNSHRPINLRALLVAAVVAALGFAALGVFAFTRPMHRTATEHIPYTQQVTFSYRGNAAPGPVYPAGLVNTGDPVFLQLVHQLRVQADYSLTTSAPVQLAGTQQLILRMTGPTGWTREEPLTPFKHFTGTQFRAAATLDLDSIQSLVKQIQKLTGMSSPDGYTLAVVPQVHVIGTVSGHTAAGSFEPKLNFQLAPPQLRPSAAVSDSGQLQPNYSPAEHGSVATTSTVPNRVSLAGASVSVDTLWAISIGGFLLSVLSVVLLSVLVKRSEPFGEAGKIQAQFGHLIVPIAGTADDLAWAPFDVPNIDALVRLAQACDRLILHYREGTLDTYLVNDEGTVYRYQSRHSGVVWGEWSVAPAARLDSVPPPAGAPDPVGARA